MCILYLLETLERFEYFRLGLGSKPMIEKGYVLYYYMVIITSSTAVLLYIIMEFRIFVYIIAYADNRVFEKYCEAGKRVMMLSAVRVPRNLVPLSHTHTAYVEELSHSHSHSHSLESHSLESLSISLTEKLNDTSNITLIN